MSDNDFLTTVYVGNLHHSVSEELLITLFSQIGPVRGCKVIVRKSTSADPYAFVEFDTHETAANALLAMHRKIICNKEIVVNWASLPGSQPRVNTSNHHNIFVGDLSPEIGPRALREAFSPFGEISNVKIVKDLHTLKPKGYAFVSFINKSDAENAIISMNGQWLGSRCIRTNWSSRKPRETRERPVNLSHHFDDVLNQSSPTNCTVYCGGFYSEISDELVYAVFSQFGTIQGIRCFKDKGYAFIKFTTKDAAIRAIETVNNVEFNGNILKCFWGKETADPNYKLSSTNQAKSYMHRNLHGDMLDYCYPHTATSVTQLQGTFSQHCRYTRYDIQMNCGGTIQDFAWSPANISEVQEVSEAASIQISTNVTTSNFLELKNQ